MTSYVHVMYMLYLLPCFWLKMKRSACSRYPSRSATATLVFGFWLLLLCCGSGSPVQTLFVPFFLIFLLRCRSTAGGDGYPAIDFTGQCTLDEQSKAMEGLPTSSAEIAVVSPRFRVLPRAAICQQIMNRSVSDTLS